MAVTAGAVAGGDKGNSIRSRIVMSGNSTIAENHHATFAALDAWDPDPDPDFALPLRRPLTD
jgi:hypothetical protein